MEKIAEYQISSSVNEDILEITLTGKITKDAIPKLEFEVNDIIKLNNLKNLLVDFRAIKGRFGYIEAYERVRNYPPDRYKVKNAIVDIPEHADLESFQETTANNAGLSWKSFTDIDKARAWLKSK
jgi:hypothetical protein